MFHNLMSHSKLRKMPGRSNRLTRINPTKYPPGPTGTGNFGTGGSGISGTGKTDSGTAGIPLVQPKKGTVFSVWKDYYP